MLSILTLALLPTALSSPLTRRWQNPLAKDAVKAGKLYFGTEISSYYLANEAFSATLTEEFNQYTPENEMKWEVIEPERGQFNWTGSDLVCSCDDGRHHG